MPVFRLPPLLLSGNPGCGKTALAKRIAALLAVPHAEIDMASVHTSFTVVGLDIGYAAAILTRLTVTEVPQPTAREMPAVIDSIHRDLLSTADWAAWFEQPLSAEVVTALTALSPRSVMRAIEDAYASAASAGRRVVIPADVRNNRSQTHQRHPIGFIQSNASPETRT